MLIRMTERGEIKKQSFDFGVADLFMLPTTPKLKGYDKYKHEKGGADLFVAFYPHIQAWSYEHDIGTDRADRGLKIGDVIVYIEVDRCTEGLKTVDKKIESYLSYSRDTGERFYVLYSILAPDNKVANRGEALTELFRSKGKGNKFLASNHNNLVNFPMGKMLYSPNGILSFSDLY